MMAHLFLCAIGPVQDFIASARRSRDLWYGSWMLSELSKAAARALVKHEGISALIFPSPASDVDLLPMSTFNVPNKIVAMISDTPQNVEGLVKSAIDGRLDALQKEAFKNIRGSFNENIAEQQIADLVEFYWVAVPLEAGRYREVRSLAESLLASRKATRNFRQASGYSVPKSSLDGMRESVIPKSAYPTRGDSPDEVSKQLLLYHRYGARRSEQLSGVDLLKRLGQRSSSIEQQFHSTSHMAALPFLERVNRRKGEGAAQQLLQRIQETLKEEDIDAEDKDGSLLYISRLREWVPDQKLTSMKEQVGDLLKEYGGDVAPNPYYALLLADGDNMGKVIDHQKSQEDHKTLSQALSVFAQSVGPTVESCQGVPIYAGGDDVLAYLPAHTVLECATKLADDFSQQLETFKTKDGRSPTLSVGIVIVHHLTPLSDALSLARQAERAAKEVDGKNALAVTISKRSGVDRTVTGQRDVLIARLQKMVVFLRKGDIGKGVAYELQNLHRVLGEAELPPEALAAEAQRIIERKRETGGEKVVGEVVQEQFSTWLESDGVPIDRLAQELIVAGSFATIFNLAEGNLTEKQELTK